MHLTKIIAIDTSYAERAAGGRFPFGEFRDLLARSPGVDVLEMLATVVKRVPEDDTAEAVAEAARRAEQKQFALEMIGCRVIVCPAKRSQSTKSGFKQSDDQRLMTETLICCMRLKPDFLTMVAADGDYAPLVWGLRREGIRTEVVATPESLASDLKRAAFTHIELEATLRHIEEGGDHVEPDQG